MEFERKLFLLVVVTEKRKYFTLYASVMYYSCPKISLCTFDDNQTEYVLRAEKIVERKSRSRF